MAIGTAAAILGSAVIGGTIASRGASRAARAQTQAADQAAQVQRDIFERQTELHEPFRQAGITSQNELLRLLGLGGEAGTPGYGSIGAPFTAEQMQADPGYAFRLAYAVCSRAVFGWRSNPRRCPLRAGNGFAGVHERL